jgi:hypothetical protein
MNCGAYRGASVVTNRVVAPSVVAKPPIIIKTISDLGESGMTLGLRCQPCGRWDEIIPAEWLNDGRPDVDYIRPRFSFCVCGGKANK